MGVKRREKYIKEGDEGIERTGRMETREEGIEKRIRSTKWRQ